MLFYYKRLCPDSSVCKLCWEFSCELAKNIISTAHAKVDIIIGLHPEISALKLSYLAVHSLIVSDRKTIKCHGPNVHLHLTPLF